jgi:hypothetical protein
MSLLITVSCVLCHMNFDVPLIFCSRRVVNVLSHSCIDDN